MVKFYTGIGDRAVPEEVLAELEDIAYILADKGYVLRTANSGGADTAFINGAKEQGGDNNVEIWIPWPSYCKGVSSSIRYMDSYVPFFDVVSNFHPAWDNCSEGAKKLLTRYLFTVTGEELADTDSYSEFLVCWTPEAIELGGVGLAINLARYSDIPVFNLADDTQKESFIEFLEDL